MENYSGDMPAPVLETSRPFCRPLRVNEYIHEGRLHQTWRDDWIFGLLKREYQPPMP
jgi:hypothetical protein